MHFLCRIGYQSCRIGARFASSDGYGINRVSPQTQLLRDAGAGRQKKGRRPEVGVCHPKTCRLAFALRFSIGTRWRSEKLGGAEGAIARSVAKTARHARRGSSSGIRRISKASFPRANMAAAPCCCGTAELGSRQVMPERAIGKGTSNFNYMEKNFAAAGCWFAAVGSMARPMSGIGSCSKSAINSQTPRPTLPQKNH